MKFQCQTAIGTVDFSVCQCEIKFNLIEFGRLLDPVYCKAASKTVIPNALEPSMNTKFYSALFIALLQTSVFAETYTCASDLSHLNRAGEVEIINYTRNGNDFYSKSNNGVFKFEVIYESNTDILLMNSFQGENEAGFLMAGINKINNQYINNYIRSGDVVNRQITKPTGGKCLLN
jgi:hypothetical protein